MKTMHPLATALFAWATLTAAALARPPPAPSAMAVEFSRGQLGAQLEENIATGERAFEVAREQANRLRGEGRTRFEAAARDVRTASQRLRESLAAAQKASAGEWERARAALAADYEAYAQALAEAQRIALSVTPERHGRSRSGAGDRER